MTHHLRIGITALAVLALAAAGVAEIPRLDDLKKTLKREKARIEEDRQSAMGDLAARYDRALDALVERAKNAADVKTYAAAIEEQNRFMVRKSVPDEAHGVKAVEQLRQAYREGLAQAELTARKRRVALLGRYISHLSTLIRDLLEAERLDDARRVEKERDRATFVRDDLATAIERDRPKDSPAVVVPKGLAAYYPLDGDTRDAGPQGRHGRLVGEKAYEPGVRGQALRFGMEGAWFVDIGKQVRFSAFTLSVWIRADRKGHHEHRTVISRLHNREPHRGRNFELYLERNGAVSVIIPDGKAWRTMRSRRTVEADRWHYLVLVYDGKDATLWMDGKTDARQQLPGYAESKVPIHIGSRPWNSQGPAFMFDGLIDEVRIYGRALSKNEILRLYRQ